VSDWVFRSPVSYWDPNYYGGVIGVVEVGLAGALTVLLCLRLRQWRERLLVLGVSAPLLISILLTGDLHGLHGMG
jgi:hypothetical protein